LVLLTVAWGTLAAPMATAQVGADPNAAGTQCTGAPTGAADPSMGISFDVVSIKPNNNPYPKGAYGVTMPPDGDSINIDFYTSADIVKWAYHLVNPWRDGQYEGAPKWFSTDRYDIRAKVADSDVAAWHKLDKEARRYVMRKVLAERFHFACHIAVVENQPVYNLVVAKDGLKIKEAKPGEVSPYHFHAPGDPSTPYAGSGVTTRPAPGGYITVFQQFLMSSLSQSFLTDEVGRQVIDKTGLTGVYNFSLDFASQRFTTVGPVNSDDSAYEPSGPSIFTALEKQLGLKLEPARGPVSHFIVDHIEKPTED
jgi:uncharacterized protein (TIGR03435 family)